MPRKPSCIYTGSANLSIKVRNSKTIEAFQQPPCSPPRGKEILERFFVVLHSTSCVRVRACACVCARVCLRMFTHMRLCLFLCFFLCLSLSLSLSLPLSLLHTRTHAQTHTGLYTRTQYACTRIAHAQAQARVHLHAQTHACT